MTDPFQLFLNELAEAFEFHSLTPDTEGACLLSLKNAALELLFEFDEQLVPNTILFSTFLCTLPQKNKIDILEACLKGNEQSNATLSCKPDEEVVYLHSRVHPDIRAAELKSWINEFVDQAMAWRKKIEEMEQASPKPHRFPLPPPTFEVPP